MRAEITTAWVKMLLMSVRIDGAAFAKISLIERIHILLALCLHSSCDWKALPLPPAAAPNKLGKLFCGS